MRPNWFEYCIYTIRHSEELEKVIRSGGKGKFSERRLWKTGWILLQEAKEEGLKFPIFFGASEQMPGLYYFGVLTSITLFEDENRTEYTFENLTRITVPKPLDTLILKNSGKPLSNKYIRPYAICITPEGVDEWIMVENLPPGPAIKRTGEERFTLNFQKLDFSLKDFWQWAFSDIIGNTVRGVLAEYIVAKALDLAEGIRKEWEPFDLITESGLKIEVKSASYIQSWYQRKFSEIKFSIRKTRRWDNKTNTYTGEPKRQADIYIFCVLSHRVPDTLNPLELGQWEFYILPTEVIDREMGDSKQVSLNKLRALGAIKCGFKEIREKIKRLEEQLLLK